MHAIIPAADPQLNDTTGSGAGTGTLLSRAEVASQISNYAGRSGDLAVSTGATTLLDPGRPFIQWSQRVSAAAGAGAYTRKLVLSNETAEAGAIFRVSIEFAASNRPTVEIYDGDALGDPIEVVTNITPGQLAYYIFEAEYDGSNWAKLDGRWVQ